MKKTVILLLVLLSLVLTACGGGGEKSGQDEATKGDANRGKALFEKVVIGSSSAPGCITCHSLEPGTTLVGPALAGIASTAGERVAGQSAADYLKESIEDPDAYVVEGFFAGIMYKKYKTDLTGQEMQDLVAYLTTLK